MSLHSLGAHNIPSGTELEITAFNLMLPNFLYSSTTSLSLTA